MPAIVVWILLSHYVPFIPHSTWQKSTRIDVMIAFTVRFPLISPNFISLCSFEQWSQRSSEKNIYIINHIMKRKKKWTKKKKNHVKYDGHCYFSQFILSLSRLSSLDAVLVHLWSSAFYIKRNLTYIAQKLSGFRVRWTQSQSINHEKFNKA